MRKRKIVKSRVGVTAVALALSTILGGNLVFVPSVSASQTTAESSTTQITSANYNYSADALEALDYINEIRSKMGLGSVVLNSFLTQSAVNHANYLTINNTTGHGEDPNKEGYTGERGKDRALAVGASADIANSYEIIDYKKSDVKSGIDRFMETAYHRVSLVDPDASDIGVGFVGGNLVIQVAVRNKATETSLYPYPNQTGVGVLFDGNETPNPLEQFGISQSGFVISFMSPYAKTSGDTEVVEAVITDSEGVEVDYFYDIDAGCWLFYPKSELKYNEKYTVSINYSPLTGSDKGKVFNKTWSFTTKSDPTTSSSVGTYSSSAQTPEPVVTPSGSISAVVSSTGSTSKDISVRVNGETIFTDPKPISLNNSTFVPLRGVLEALGATLSWDQGSQKVTILHEQTEIILTVGSKTAYVDGVMKSLSQAPLIKSGSTYVPLRFISEAIGASVGWDSEALVVSIDTK